MTSQEDIRQAVRSEQQEALVMFNDLFLEVQADSHVRNNPPSMERTG
jgi:hypothetical protein